MSRMLRMKSKMADGEMSAADSNTSLQGKKSGYTFGQNETLLLISLYQKYKENCCDNGCNGSLFVGRHICYAMFTRPGPTGVFLCRQSKLFLAFRTNHSYSRIVDKKNAPQEKAECLGYATDKFPWVNPTLCKPGLPKVGCLIINQFLL